MNLGQFLVVGSLCAHPDDRVMERKDIIPVQLFTEGKLYPVNVFNEYGELGVSSVTFNIKEPLTLYFTTGNDLFSINLENKKVKEYSIDNLKDIHEIHFIGNEIWIANTALNEVVIFNPKKSKVIERINLYDSIANLKVRKRNREEIVEDRFHANTVFQGLDNNIYALVHHFDGKQRKIIGRIIKKALKLQGDGGVVNLSTKESINLKLAAPHTVRIIQGNYWIFSSGESVINIYNPNWLLIDTLKTSGFGRGGDISLSKEFYYVGISATRKRYIERYPKEMHIGNIVEIFNIYEREKIYDIVLNNIEQINNIYTMVGEQASLLHRLR